MLDRLVLLVEVGKVQTDLQLGRALQRRAVGDLGIKVDGFLGQLLLLGNAGELQQDHVVGRVQRPGELQVNANEIFAARLVQRGCDIVHRLARTLGRVLDELADVLAVTHLVAQRQDRQTTADETIGIVQHLERGILFAFAGQETGIRFGCAQIGVGRGTAGILVGERCFEAFTRFIIQASRFGDQGAMIAHEQPKPRWSIKAIERIERCLRGVSAKLCPG